MQDGNKTLLPWWELRLQVPKDNADDLAALLVDDGALGVQTVAGSERHGDAWTAHPSMGPSSSNTPLGVDHLDELPQPQGDHLQLVASFPGDWSQGEVTSLATQVLTPFGLADALVGVVPTRRSDTDWAHAWRRHFKPMKIGRRLWIVPSWESHFLPPQGSIVLPLDPGMAFGTGQHATTALCLRMLENLADPKHPIDRVLDVGCGSGILAMGALALGARTATLMDIDVAAVQASEENLTRAGFSGRFTATTALPDKPGSYPLVVANILAPTLCELADALLAQLAPGGRLLLSGILADQAASVVQACGKAAKARNLGPLQLERLHHEPWVALLLTASAG